jgi:hypothetical protein
MVNIDSNKEEIKDIYYIVAITCHYSENDLLKMPNVYTCALVNNNTWKEREEPPKVLPTFKIVFLS